MPFYFTTEQQGIEITLLITDWPSIMANHGPTNMANHELTIMANQNNQNFGAKMQSRERNQNFRSHAIRGYCCEQNYGRF